MRKVTLGDPSLSGKDSNALVDEAFGDASFPLTMQFTNRVPFAVSFPEISGLYMEPCNHGDAAVVVVVIPTSDALRRLTSSIEQIAFLNQREVLLEMEEFVVEVEAESDEESDDEKEPAKRGRKGKG